MHHNSAEIKPSSPTIRLLWYVLVAATILLYLQNMGFYEPNLSLSLITSRPESIQLFCDQGGGFREDSSRRITTIKDAQNGSKINIPIAGDCKKIRLDLGGLGSTVTLLSATLKTSHGLQQDIFPNIQSGQFHEVHGLASKNTGGIDFISDGEDPFVVLEGSFSAPSRFGSIGFNARSILLFLIIVTLLSATDYMARKDVALSTTVLIGILLRVIFYFYNNLPTDADQLWTHWHDEGTYYAYAGKLLHSGVLGYFNSPSSVEVAPGYALYLSSMLSLFDGHIMMIRLFSLLFFSSAIIILTFNIANQLFSRKIAIVAALLVAIYPQLIEFAPALLTEYLFIASLMTFIFVALKIANIQKGQCSTIHISALITVGFLAGVVAAITRLVFLPIIFLWLGYSAYLYWKSHSPQASIALATLMLSILIGLVPFFQNGHKHSGHYMIATGSGTVLWLGSRSDTDGDDPPYRKKNYDTELITHGASHLSLEGDRLLRAAALNNIAANPLNYMLMNVKKIGRLTIGNSYAWFAPSSTYSDWAKDQAGHDRFEKLFSLFVATIVAIFGAAYVLIYRKDNHQAILVYMIALALIAIYLPFMVNPRYGLPIFVLTAIFSVHTAVQTWKAKGKYIFLSLTALSITITTLIANGTF